MKRFPLHRGGSIYLTVLMGSLMVASLAMAALSAAHHHARGINSEGSLRGAQIACDSGLDWAVSAINSSPNWRTRHQHNIDVTPITLGGATLTYRLLDGDGDLADDVNDMCKIIVTAKHHQACVSIEGILQPAGEPLNCLEYSVVAGLNIAGYSGSVFNTDQSMAATRFIATSGDSITANCFAGFYLGPIYGDRKPLPESLQFPGNDVFAYYEQLGTTIPYASLTRENGVGRIKRELLSPSQNSITAEVNPLGVYVIDCRGGDLVINDSRLECTLVIKNAGTKCELGNAIYWQAPRSNLPSLLVQGDLSINHGRRLLKEETTNFNPPATPYRGESDNDTSDQYPSQIHGLVYATGNITIDDHDGDNTIFGNVIAARNISGKGDLLVVHRDVYLSHPPLGFREFSKVKILPASLHRVATP